MPHPKPGTFAEMVGGGSGKPHLFTIFPGRSRLECAPWLQVARAQGRAPVVPDGLVVRPEFCVGREGFISSYAFAVADGSSNLLLTALHVMSALTQAKGINCSVKSASYSGRELPAIVTKVNLYDVFAANWMMSDLGTAGAMLVLSDARTDEEEPFAQRDIAAFGLDRGARVAPAPLASHPPRVGEPIWLAASPDKGPKVRTFEAVVVEQTDRTLVFRYASSGGIPRYCSGAPLLNDRGEVVGINVGLGELDGQRFGHSLHVASIRRHLAGPQARP